MKKFTNDDLPEVLLSKMEGFKPIETFESNGCSCSPDEFGGVDLRPACHYHDWAYHLGGCEIDRKRADQELFRNLMVCGLSKFMANFYYRRVRLWGVKAFSWHKGKVPKNPWHWVLLFWKRYITF